MGSLPAENRVDLSGHRICRWCASRLDEHTYIPIGKRKRRCALLCPRCDTGSVSWREEFRYTEPDGS